MRNLKLFYKDLAQGSDVFLHLFQFHSESLCLSNYARKWNERYIDWEGRNNFLLLFRCSLYIQWNTAAAAKSLQSCPALCDPIDGSLPGSSVHGISRQEYWSGMTLPSPGTTTGRAYYCFQTCVLTFTFLPMQNAILILFSNLHFSLIQFKPHLLPQLAPYLHHYSLCHSILILFTLFFSLTDMLLGKHSPLVS